MLITDLRSRLCSEAGTGTGGYNFKAGKVEGAFYLQKFGFSLQLKKARLTIPLSFSAFSLNSLENS